MHKLITVFFKIKDKSSEKLSFLFLFLFEAVHN